MKPSLLDALNEHPRVCDGAMGTQLMAAGMPPGRCGEMWNLEQPHAIAEIHQRYRDVGCQLITTNTFGATPTQLARHHCAQHVGDINTRAASIARDIVGDDGWALGDIGPFGDFLEPLGDTTADQLTDIFARQALALALGGADAFIIETMADPHELALAVKAARKAAPNLPVIATYAFQAPQAPQANAAQFNTMMGTTVQHAVAAAIDAGADVVGTNCGTSLGMDDYRNLARQLVAAAGSTPVIVQPNAGAPRQQNDSLIYDASPDDVAELARDLLALGVRIVGGCCGTTPDHLRAVAAVVTDSP